MQVALTESTAVVERTRSRSGGSDPTSTSSWTRTLAKHSLPGSMDCTEARFCSRKRKIAAGQHDADVTV